MRFVRSIIVLTSAGMIATGSLSAQGKDKDKSPKKDPPPAHHSKGASASVTEVEIKLIREYYAGQGAKAKPLPPGIAKNLARGKPLPPGIAKKRLPDALIVKLPARPNYQWVMAGNVIVLVDPVGIVVDILKEIF